MTTPFRVAMRSSGNQSVNAFIEPIRQAETPMPISARPIVRVARPSATEKVAEPAAAKSSSVATTSRGPCRSRNRPTGICIAAKARK
jgi:hypothetical protein